MYLRTSPYPYIPQQPVRVALPAEFMERMNVISHDTRNLTRGIVNLERRLKDLEERVEASGKRCEKLQNETQFAASQYLKYFEERIQRLENLDEPMQRFENLEKQIETLKKQVQRFEYPDAQMQRFKYPDEQMQRFENLEKQIGNLEKRVRQFEYFDEQMQHLGQGCEQSHNETRLAIEDVRVSLTAIMKRLNSIEEKAAGDKQQFTANAESLKTVRGLLEDLINGQRKEELILSTRRTLRPRKPRK